MPHDASLDIGTDPSLPNRFAEHPATRPYAIGPEDAIASLVATIIDISPYQLKKKQQFRGNKYHNLRE